MQKLEFPSRWGLGYRRLLLRWKLVSKRSSDFFCFFLNGHNSEKKVPFKGNLCYTSNFKKGKSSIWASPKRKQEILVIEGLVYKIVSTKRDQSARFYSKGSQSAKRFFSKGNQSASVSSKTATSLYNILLCLFLKVFSTKEWCP